MPKPAWKRLAVGLAIAIPLVWSLFLVLHGGRIPQHDYWDIQEELFSADGFAASAAAWFTATRAHLIPVTSLMYAANIWITGGSNLGLTSLTWFFAALQAWVLVRLARHSGLGDWWLPVIVAFCFTPVAAQPFTMGASGVAHLGTPSLSVAALYCLAGSPRCDSAGRRALGLLLALLAGLTFTTGLAASAVAVLALAWRRAGWRWIAAAAAGAAFLVLLRSSMVDAFYAERVATAAIDLPGPLQALLYLLPMLGGLFSQTVEIGGALAAAGIAIAGVVAWQERGNPRARIWLLLALLALAQASMITVGRWDKGAAQAVSSRYAAVPALFWLSALSLVALRVRERGARGVRIALAACVLSLLAAMSIIGWEYSRTLVQRAALQTAARLSVQIGVADLDAIEIAVTPWPVQFLRNRSTLQARGLVPFDRPPPIAWGSRSQLAAFAQSRPAPEAALGVQRFRERGIRIVALQPDRAGSLVLVNESGALRGAAAPLRFAPDPGVVWIGYARVTGEDRALRVIRVPEEGPPLELRRVELARLPLDERRLRLFQRLAELPRVHRAGRSLFQAGARPG